jgi:hypothetical protein
MSDGKAPLERRCARRRAQKSLSKTGMFRRLLLQNLATWNGKVYYPRLWTARGDPLHEGRYLPNHEEKLACLRQR